MKMRSRRIARSLDRAFMIGGAIAVLLSSIHAPPASAETTDATGPVGATDSKREGTNRLGGFLPALTIGVGVQLQSVSGVIESTARVTATGRQDIVRPLLPIGLELVSPRLGQTESRIFAHAEYHPPIAAERNLVREGNPTGDLTDFDAPRPTTAPRNVGGQGQLSELQQGHQWLLGIGVSIPIEFMDTVVDVKPSFNYIGNEFTMTLDYVNVQCPPGPPNCNGGPFAPPDIIDGDFSEIQHAIGPGLTFETDAGRSHYGPFRFRTFVSGRAAFFLTDKKFEETFMSETGELARVEYETESWLAQVMVGIRIVFDPR
jgi:hypothetical protein